MYNGVEPAGEGLKDLPQGRRCGPAVTADSCGHLMDSSRRSPVLRGANDDGWNRHVYDRNIVRLAEPCNRSHGCIDKGGHLEEDPGKKVRGSEMIVIS